MDTADAAGKSTKINDLERQARAGQWLRMGDAAQLLGVSRTKMHTLVESGAVAHRLPPGGRWRRCDPHDLLRLLDDSRRERRGGTDNEHPQQAACASLVGGCPRCISLYLGVTGQSLDQQGGPPWCAACDSTHWPWMPHA